MTGEKVWRLGFWLQAKRFKNSHLQARWLYSLVVKDPDYDVVLSGKLPGSRLSRLLPRLLWFWPRITDAADWAKGDFGTLRTPDNFRSLDQHALILADAVERETISRDDPILDLGCNMGRHLVELHRRGYRRLYGVDAMATALQEFKRVEPDVYADSILSHDLFQRFLARQDDQCFATVFTHGATIELVHPSFDIIGQICRVSASSVVLLINEWCQSYPRRWEHEFKVNGFDLVRAVRPAHGGKVAEDSGNLLVFSRRAVARQA